MSVTTPITLQIGFMAMMFAMIYIAYRISRSFVAFDLNEYKANTDLSATYIEPGLNVDNLPSVTVHFGDYRPSETVGDDDENNDIGLTRVKCLQQGLYLGTENKYVNCADRCNVSSEDEVQYTFVTDNSRYISGRLHLKSGAWCLPTTAASCNTNTSLVVYSINGWMCLPKTDLFGGEGGNRILACDGSIRDNMTNETYNTYIPANLTFNDFYEDKLSDGRYRFECPPDLRDEYQNKFLRSPFNRFHLIHNYCVKDIPFADDAIRPNFETGRCNCTGKYYETETGECSICRVGFDENTFTFNLQRLPCYSVRDSVHFYERIKEQTSVNGGIIMPCGLSQDVNTTGESLQPRCVEDQLSAFVPLLPSSDSLSIIRDKILGSAR